MKLKICTLNLFEYRCDNVRGADKTEEMAFKNSKILKNHTIQNNPFNVCEPEDKKDERKTLKCKYKRFIEIKE